LRATTEQPYLKNMPKKYDVIIIGAGIGGLTAGAILARNGKKVLVLEKNHMVGGYTVNFKRKGFEFDASLHMMQGCNKSGISHNILKKCGIEKKVKFIKPKILYHSIYPDFEIKFDQTRTKSFISNLKKFFPQEKKGIDLLLKDVKQALLGFEEFQIKRKISSKMKFSFLTRTCEEIYKQYINSPRLITILSQLWPYFGLPPAKLSAYYLPFLLYDYHFNGGYYPEGGSGAIADSLRDVIVKNKSDILLNKKVDKIITNNKKAVGVILKDGEQILGDNIVSNIDARTTFLKMIGTGVFSKSFVNNLNSLEPSISAFQVYLGLDINISKLGMLDYTIFVNPSFDLSSQFNSIVKNDIKKSPFVITGYSNLENNVKANHGKIVLATLAGYDYWKNLSKDAYSKEKISHGNYLIKKAEKYIPKLRSYVKVMEIATPLTMERYSGSYKGAIYGWENNRHQCGGKRYFLKTPIENLYLAGAWTYPGGGVSGALYSGDMVSGYILSNTGKK